jgi:hypothetical protein
MRASTAVGLLFAGSMSIFGIFSTNRHHSQVEGIEPVWVNGQQGVYSPSTGEFVPSSSWDYADVCDEIRQQRAQSGGYGNPTTGPYIDSSGYYHNSHYYGSGYGYYGGSGHSSSSSSSHSFGSERGGIGATGHSFGGGHS